jgi:hypothetical protein
LQELAARVAFGRVLHQNLLFGKGGGGFFYRVYFLSKLQTIKTNENDENGQSDQK